MELGFFAGLIAAFAFGTVWFYVACVVTFFGIMALSENDHELFALVALGSFIFLMEKSGAFNIFTDPWILLKWSVLYFVIGTAWSFIKWFSFVQRKADEYVEKRVKYLTDVNTRDTRGMDKFSDKTELEYPELATITDNTPVPENLKSDFKQYLFDQYYIYRSDDNDSIIPSAFAFKSKITNWVIWWPTSALWTLLSDPMVRIANWIFSRLKGTYQLIAMKSFAKFDDI